ncbi:hypothetical protein [Streptomyces purpurascens]|uniref:Uncharacterized protein n=1 Tax=Streptomyces purpurascens TaxID=1924 RepID=A0ABZ1M9N0_STREF|nr:hypothetical protein [Streptomyces purpurascens]MCE7049744.1 hypothetical protein [Streptomyces purpurascens]
MGQENEGSNASAPDQPPDLVCRRIGTTPRGDGLDDPRVAVQDQHVIADIEHRHHQPAQPLQRRALADAGLLQRLVEPMEEVLDDCRDEHLPVREVPLEGAAPDVRSRDVRSVASRRRDSTDAAAPRIARRVRPRTPDSRIPLTMTAP